MSVPWAFHSRAEIQHGSATTARIILVSRYTTDPGHDMVQHTQGPWHDATGPGFCPFSRWGIVLLKLNSPRSFWPTAWFASSEDAGVPCAGVSLRNERASGSSLDALVSRLISDDEATAETTQVLRCRGSRHPNVPSESTLGDAVA